MPRTETIVLNWYSWDELDETQHDQASELIAEDDWLVGEYWHYYGSEWLGSVEAFTELLGGKVWDYSLGDCQPSWIKVSGIDTEDMSTARRMAWLENNLLARLRVPYGIRNRASRVNGFSPGQCDYFVTGIYSDYDIFHRLLEDIRHGETVEDSLEGMASLIVESVSSEVAYRFSSECLRDDNYEWLVDDTGKVVEYRAKFS